MNDTRFDVCSFNIGNRMYIIIVQTVFEQPYAHPKLKVPWYMIAGNVAATSTFQTFNINVNIESQKYRCRDNTDCRKSRLSG